MSKVLGSNRRALMFLGGCAVAVGVAFLSSQSAGAVGAVSNCQAVAAPKVDWHGCYLAGKDLRSTVLTGANLSGADLSGANLSNTNLTGADLTYATFLAANANYINVTRANLMRANLKNAIFTGANLTSASLYFASLLGTDLTSANLANASFYSADLTGANLTNSTGRFLDGKTATWTTVIASTCPNLLPASAFRGSNQFQCGYF